MSNQSDRLLAQSASNVTFSTLLPYSFHSNS